MRKRTVIAISADKHSGSSLGLMKPEPMQLHDGGTYIPSALQKKIWTQYSECLFFIKEERKRSRLIWIENGDLTEGVHHGTTQITTSRTDEHEQIAVDILEHTFNYLKFNKSKGDLAYIMAGTETHSGIGSRAEENIARDIEEWGIVPKNKARYTWDRLLLKVNGILFDIAHHGGSVGRRAWTTNNGMHNLVKSLYFQHLEDETKIPRYFIRSHLHKYAYGQYKGKRGEIEGFVTPSFQFKTGYAYRVAGSQLSDIGMVIIVIEEDGRCWHKIIKNSYAQDETQVV